MAHYSEAHEASCSLSRGERYPPAVRTRIERWHVVDGIILGENQKPYNSEYFGEGTPKGAYVEKGIIYDGLCEDNTTSTHIKQLTFDYINEGKGPIQAR